MTRKQKRGVLIGGGVATLAVALILVLFALKDSVVFFHTPSDIVEKGVPAGQRITAMSVSFSFIDTTQNTLQVDWEWAVTTWPSNVARDNCFVIKGPGMGCRNPVASATGGDLLGNLPTTADRYLITHGTGMLWQDFAKPVGGYLDYTVSIDVTAVPEPASWLLALGGLPLVGGLARSRRARRA